MAGDDCDEYICSNGKDEKQLKAVLSRQSLSSGSTSPMY